MSEHTTQPGFETSVADLVEMVKQCTGHPDRQEPRAPSHFDLIQQARKAAEVLAEDNAWLHNKLRDRDERIAELESTVARLVAELDQVKADANAALRAKSSPVERDVADQSPCDCSPDCADDQRSA